MKGYSLEDAKRQVGAGWHELLDEVYDRKPKDVVITDVKEKYAGLRIYFIGHDESFFDYLISVEHRSHKICELCGEPAKVVDIGGWYKALCDAHNSAYTRKDTE